MDRSKKRDLLWKKAILHFTLCFSLGFLAGLAPTSSHRLFSPEIPPYVTPGRRGLDPVHRTLFPVPPPPPPTPSADAVDRPPKLLIAVTTTTPNDPLRWPSLERLSRTLRLVPPPLLWIVVGPVGDAEATAGALRMTGVMHRQLVSREDFADPEAEAEHQRQAALEHIVRHRLDGIVHFAELSNVYDLRLFEEIRATEVFGTWPVASLSPNGMRVTIEGPVCESSQVLGWHVKDANNGTRESGVLEEISGFAFNSSILWDPERWGRLSSDPDSSSQDAMKYVREAAVEDETKIMAFPPDCSRVMLWIVHVPKSLVLVGTASTDLYPNEPSN